MEHFLFSMIYGIILPNWQFFFQRGRSTTNQIIKYYKCVIIYVHLFPKREINCCLIHRMPGFLQNFSTDGSHGSVVIRAHHEEKWTGKSHPTMEWWLVDVRSKDSLKLHYLSFVNYFLERNMNYIYQHARNGGSWMTRSNTSSVLTVVYVSLCQDRTDGKPPARVLL